MKQLLTLFVIALFSSTAASSAHALLVKSTPPDGSASMAPPSVFVLEFSEPAHLYDLSITKNSGKSTRINRLTLSVSNTITIAAPSLTPGRYVLEWTVLTEDSRALRGSIRFTVYEAPAPSSAQ